MTYANLLQQQPTGREQFSAEPSSVDLAGLRITARLDDGVGDLPYDISERLRAARMQALGKRKVSIRMAPAVTGSGNSAAGARGDDGPGLWARLASVLPLVALVAGLVMISMAQNEDRARELAEVDTALLTDDLPPSAYADPGFVQFLRSGAGERPTATP